MEEVIVDVDAPAPTKPVVKRRKRAKKQKKNKPKKAMTPFMVFSKETRKRLVAENPNLTFSEIGRELGARWRQLAQPDREIFIIKAEEDYQRFLSETELMESQNPLKKKKTTEQKNQTKVKKSISAYLYFCKAHREQVKATHPDMKMVGIQRVLADKWMNSSPAVKLPFEKQAEADRQKYNSEIHSEGPSCSSSRDRETSYTGLFFPQHQLPYLHDTVKFE